MRALIQLVAGLMLLLLIWRAFRMAMGMRYARVVREDERRVMEARGRRVVAEVPSREGDVSLFLESDDAFEWQGQVIPKAQLTGCRLLLNGGLMAAASRPGAALPDPDTPEEYEGRERWDVRLYAAGGRVLDVPCGTFREGVSRDAAARAVFHAVRAAATGESPGHRSKG